MYMKYLIFSIFLFNLYSAFPQANIESNSLDDKYLEDQFYLGITYNFMLDKPQDITQRNLSYGLQGGIIKDMPLNANRTVSIGLGLGYAVNSYYSNMIFSETENGLTYARADDDLGVKRSKVETHLVELPLEFRWRSSNAEEFKFWRVYTGIKLGYIFGSRSKVVTNSNKYSFDNPDIKKLHYGLMFNIGYNTFNVHIYYSLNKFFNDDVFLSNEQINMKPLRVGLIFYIL